MDLTHPLVYGGPTFVALILVELAYSRTHGNKDLYKWKDMAASFAMGAGAAVVGAFMKVAWAAAIFFGAYEIFNPEVNGVRMNIMGYQSFQWSWYTFLICQLLDDFSYYWFHRLNHTVRVLWAAHIVHHSSENFNLGTGIRNGWFTILYKPFFYVWIPIIGFPPEMLIFCIGIEAIWQFQLHTKYVKKLGFLEKFLNTHTQHQVHHSQNPEYLDKNHGGYLNLFDKMFGSFKELDDNIDIKYGVVHAPKNNNPMEILLHEYRDIWNDVKKSKNIKEAFMYIFGPPGWSPDGSSMTVRQIQRQLKEEKQKAEKAQHEPVSAAATA